jgi:hypothetical protein
MRRLSPVLALLFALALLGVAAGCGGSDDDEESTTPAEAVTEIGEIKTMLATAVAQVRAGDADAAEETVGDAYLEHYEHVEGPLGERDHDLMEEIEEAVATELRDKIKDRAPADEVAALVSEIEADIAKGEAALR